MPREMKIWLCNLDGTINGLVAAPTKTRAAQLLGVSLNWMNNYGGETWNEGQVRLALAHPEVAFGGPINDFGSNGFMPLADYQEKLKRERQEHYETVLRQGKPK